MGQADLASAQQLLPGEKGGNAPTQLGVGPAVLVAPPRTSRGESHTDTQVLRPKSPTDVSYTITVALTEAGLVMVLGDRLLQVPQVGGPERGRRR